MKPIFFRTIAFLLMLFLLVASSPYILPAVISAHGEHTYHVSFAGNAFKIALQHSSNSEDTLLGDSGSAETKDHELFLSSYPSALSAAVSVKQDKATILIIPVLAAFFLKFVCFMPRLSHARAHEFKIPSYLTLRKTIVLHI